MNDSVLHLQDIRRSFTEGAGRLDVLRGCDLSVARGERVALIGPSGAGKSTLLQIAGLLESPDSGKIFVNGKEASTLDDAGRTSLRSRAIGFVYQFHHLLPEFSARENTCLPQMIAGCSQKEALRRTNELLELVGLAARAEHRPAQLSGGEQQRIAIARALANRPAILIADEPTGNLDPHTSEQVFAVLQDIVRHEGLGLLMATHNHDLAGRMDRIVQINEGVLVEV